MTPAGFPSIATHWRLGFHAGLPLPAVGMSDYSTRVRRCAQPLPNDRPFHIFQPYAMPNEFWYILSDSVPKFAPPAKVVIAEGPVTVLLNACM